MLTDQEMLTPARELELLLQVEGHVRVLLRLRHLRGDPVILRELNDRGIRLLDVSIISVYRSIKQLRVLLEEERASE